MASCHIHTKLERQQEQFQHDQQLCFLAFDTGQFECQDQAQHQQKQHIEEWRRTIVSVQEMGFSSSEFSLVENKGGGGNFCWAGGAGANHSEADFFDEFVVLDGAEAASASTSTSHGLHSTVTPPGSAGVQRQVQHRGGRIGGGGGQQGAMGSQQHLDMVDMGGLPRHYHETPGMGSISDSELLRLEGLSMRSPRAPMAATSASEPASPPSRSISPRKAGRLETLYTKAKAKVATFQGKGKQNQRSSVTRPATVAQAPVLSTALMGTRKPTSRPRPYNLNIEKANAPLSPALTNSVVEGNSAMVSHGAAQFDLRAAHDFFSGYGSTGIPATPLDTPALDSTRTTTASSVSFTNPVPDTSSLLWDPTMQTNGMEMDIDHPDFFTTPTSYKTDFQLAFQQLQQQGYTPETLHDAAASLSSSGLMIHMPQPRGPAPAVLHPTLQLAAAQAQQARFHYPPPPPLPQNTNTAAARPGRGQDPNPSPRRPRPRAPSSGARHHYHASGAPSAMAPSTPRKARTASGSGSGSITTTPTTATGPPNRLHRRSASMQALRTAAADASTPSSSIRKRKSWTGRRVSSSHHDASLSASLTLNGSPRKSHASHHQCRTSTARTSTANLSSASAAAAAADMENFERDKEADGFVNFTPNDHAVLMTGVAPSGSSKTKARREREAAEAKRKTLEAVRNVVAAAGGDVSKLDMEGAWLDGRRV